MEFYNVEAYVREQLLNLSIAQKLKTTCQTLLSGHFVVFRCRIHPPTTSGFCLLRKCNKILKKTHKFKTEQNDLNNELRNFV